MIDLRPTIIAKSDQLNADDLIGGPMTITITDVRLLDAADQPVAVHWEGGDGRPYKPCKSMRRVMAKVWGEDGKAFIGQRMTVYRDDKVRFGSDAVGGVRISHMSGIDREATMALMVTRGKRAPFTVKPLPSVKGGASTIDLRPILIAGRAAAARGSAELTAWWTGLGREEKVAAKPTLDAELKAAATKADQSAFDETDHDPDTGEVIDTTSPGDRPPSAGEDAAAGPAETSEGSGLAVDVIGWADKLISDLPFFTPEQIAFLESDRKTKATFAVLMATDLDKAKALEAAIKAAG
jgi:hypothetical protein